MEPVIFNHEYARSTLLRVLCNARLRVLGVVRRATLRNIVVALYLRQGGRFIPRKTADSSVQSAISAMCAPDYAELQIVTPGYYRIISRQPTVTDLVVDEEVDKALAVRNLPWERMWFNANQVTSQAKQDVVKQICVLHEEGATCNTETPVGLLDIETPTRLYVVEAVSDWRQALGSLCAIKAALQSAKTPVMALYGNIELNPNIRTACAQLGVEIQMYMHYA